MGVLIANFFTHKFQVQKQAQVGTYKSTWIRQPKSQGERLVTQRLDGIEDLNA